jgi:hypothetical protein
VVTNVIEEPLMDRIEDPSVQDVSQVRILPVKLPFGTESEEQRSWDELDCSIESSGLSS